MGRMTSPRPKPPSPLGVSFVVPVHNGARWLDRVLEAIYAQHDGRPMEVLAVEDGSTDRSLAILERHRRQGRLLVVRGQRRGAAAAANLGIAHAHHPVICQVDQDVVVQPGWMSSLLAELEGDPRVAAVQGYYATDRRGPLLARVMGYDLELRYAAINTRHVDHVCTGNTAYRASALRGAGGFDERLGYGYDNDMSYRLCAAGHTLVFQKEARSMHHWRDGLWPYLKQQYGVGYGRLDLVNKHRGRRVKGDDVSGLRMILHVPLTLAALGALLLTPPALLLGGPVAGALPLGVVGLCLGTLTLDRTVAALQAYARFRDPACLAFPAVHLARDLAWAAATLRWTLRRVSGQEVKPRHSMPG